MLAVIGLILTLGSIPAYAFTVDVAFLRSSGALMFGLAAIGLVLGLTALKKPGLGRKIAFALNLAIVGLLIYGFFFMTKLPERPALALQKPLEFSLPDHNGNTVSLAELRKKGPVHLVLYRGHW